LATTFHKLPSEVLGERDPLAAWMFDCCCMYFGTMVENMLQERDKVGAGSQTEYVNRYSLSQLLDPAFVFPAPAKEPEESGWGPGFEGVDGLIVDRV